MISILLTLTAILVIVIFLISTFKRFSKNKHNILYWIDNLLILSTFMFLSLYIYYMFYYVGINMTLYKLGIALLIVIVILLIVMFILRIRKLITKFKK